MIAYKNALIAFIKTPLAQYVKTRLSSNLKDSEIVALYSAFLRDLDRKHNTGSNYDYWYAIAPEKYDASALARIVKLDNKFLQTGNSIGDRMRNAFSHLFRKGYQKVVLIGSDIPNLSRAIVQEALEKLEKYQCVIGPSEDGGYYLIALKQNSTKLFNNISWSTPYVLQQTLQAAEREKISVLQLSKLYDIDTIKELKRLQNDLINMNKLSPDFPVSTWDVLTRIFHKFEQ
jgi:rSAM/selenodomain-associated transferase 1